MAKFKVGDEVYIRKDLKENTREGILVVKKEMVELAQKGRKHTISFVDPDGTYKLRGVRYLWWSNYMLIPAKTNTAHNRRIVIEVSDKGATAKYIDGKAVLKEESVKRYHKDEPNDYNAACAVLAKLFPDDAKPKTIGEPTYYSGKVVCVDSNSTFYCTVGKIYEFVNGKAKLDNDVYFPLHELKKATLAEINEISGLKFIELVED